jgi:PAS domain S-box-containing protein
MAMIAFRESNTARWVTDKHGMCVDVNDRAIELFQLPRDKMLGRGWTQRIRTSQIPEVSAAFDNAYNSNGHIHYKARYVLDYDDGSSVTVVAEQSDIVRDDEGIYQMSGTVIPLPSNTEFRTA